MMDTAPATLLVQRARVRVSGRVQGVGYRPWVYALARRMELTGWVQNDAQGVLLEVQGAGCDAFVRALENEAPPTARVDRVEHEPVAPLSSEMGFTIVESGHHGSARVAIGPDASVCDACLEELFDPRDRRHGYAFLNCTHCGPRYTITRGLPYDRPQTSMAGFQMCPDCDREYHDPTDRRFHAQPIACPACGPRLSLSVEDAWKRLAGGAIGALKGLGGFLLACDARNTVTVDRLRHRKQRDAKPFAVMVANLESARRLVHLDDDEEALLQSPARPVVLAQRRQEQLARGVAPDLKTLGVMLPNTPLHYLLFHEAAGRPDGTSWLHAPQDTALVMTSANPGGEPIIVGNAEAHAQLDGIADFVVTHDRDIVVRADDSVVRVIDHAPAFLRRARGYVPDPVALSGHVPSVVALGAYLKNTVCFTRGSQAFVSQHVGDLDDVQTHKFLQETLAHLQQTLEVKPVAVAHDLHPDFLSTRLAHTLGIPAIPVQHHHAHLASVMAEHRRDQPTAGLALDGFGLGSDGGSWGGELMLVNRGKFQRWGHLKAIPQPGGDVAARQPWRMGASALFAMGRGKEILPRFSAVGASPVFMAMLEKGVQSPLTSSMGRVFDAACGLLGVRPVASYEAEAPMLLEGLVRQPVVKDGAWHIVDGVLDLLPLLGLLPGMSAEDGAEVFHGTLVAALVAWALPLAKAHGNVVALGGGCLANRVLAEGLVAGFSRHGVRALLPRQVPANDGGLSLGQAMVAAWQLME